MVTFHDTESLRIYIPSNLAQLNFIYANSKFIECNTDLARNNLSPNYTQNNTLNNIIRPALIHIAKTLETFQKHYFLAGGSLLGW
jgi:hypothetical protein